MNSLVADITEKKSSLYTEEELSHLGEDFIPSHVAIIMDGNRRWAKKKGLPASVGHWKGAEVLSKIVRAASQLGIKTLTVFAFSTENWKRSSLEINALMHLIKIYLIKQRESMIKEGVKLETIGNLSRLPIEVQNELQRTKELTKSGENIELVLALNYGGRDEIRRAICKILSIHDAQKLDMDSITEEFISSHLDTAPFGDPEFVIRTSGEQRVSNFLLWQICYSELYTTDVLWPDFSTKHLYEAILAYQGRKRRKGS